MERKKSIAWIVIFCILFVLPMLSFPIYKFLGETENNENRKLAQFPDIREVGVEQYPDAFDEWFSDHLPYKQQLVTSLNQLTYNVFFETQVEKVVIGKDNWLFYNGAFASDGDPIGQYKGTQMMDEALMQDIAQNMTKTNETLKEKGIQFVLLIGPNKEEIYEEKMPDKIKRISAKSETDYLVEYLRENTDVTVIYPKDELISMKNTYPLYYQGDTHWTTLGAFVALQQIEEELYGTRDYLSDISYTSATLESVRCTKDLETMLNSATYENVDEGYYLENYPINDDRLWEDGQYVSINAEHKEKILFIGDSFRISTKPYVRNAYSESYYQDRLDMEPGLIDSQQPDIVVLEIVARKASKLSDINILE